MSVLSRGPASAQARALRLPDAEYAKVRSRLRKGPVSLTVVPEPAPFDANDPESVKDYALRAVLADLEADGQATSEMTVGRRLSDGRFSIVQTFSYVFPTADATGEAAEGREESPHVESVSGDAGHQLRETPNRRPGRKAISQRTGLEVLTPGWSSAPGEAKSYV